MALCDIISYRTCYGLTQSTSRPKHPSLDLVRFCCHSNDIKYGSQDPRKGFQLVSCLRWSASQEAKGGRSDAGHLPRLATPFNQIFNC